MTQPIGFYLNLYEKQAQYVQVTSKFKQILTSTLPCHGIMQDVKYLIKETKQKTHFAHHRTQAIHTLNVVSTESKTRC